ncbi:hypothetical protein [Pseudogracilibacillus sp. SO30301A]|uniref:hypothetical protein n=1 Tax=Pseudogracilibacillus sp. SO30301A TaxID=3098291 RepID=UPI00300E57F3
MLAAKGGFSLPSLMYSRKLTSRRPKDSEKYISGAGLHHSSSAFSLVKTLLSQPHLNKGFPATVFEAVTMDQVDMG